MQNLTSALNTDLYELTMAAGYFNKKVDLQATFELFCYKWPSKRSYFLACGLEQAIDYILKLRFSDDDISKLKSHPVLRSAGEDFFAYLKNFAFTGDVWAMPEGTPFFPLEPIIQIKAPIIEAQIIETYLLSTIHIQTLVATKASRIVRASSADGNLRDVVDFGSRRAHGPEAAVLAARAAYIGGCTGTSNVFAGIKFGIPTYGTMAHSWVEAYDTEEEAFKNYNDIFPENTVALIDTYDSVKGARIASRMNRKIEGIRLDSGDLGRLSKRTRKILDKEGLNEVKIMASGNLDEYKILKLVKRKAPIDFFGVGTAMVTSGDMPNMDFVYKLVETESPDGSVKYKGKCSQGKRTLVGKKQVYRYYTNEGMHKKDMVCLASENPPTGGKGMLEQVIKNGNPVKGPPPINKIREYTRSQIKLIPEYCADIISGRYLEVDISHELKKASKKVCAH